jgi:Na+-transporting NADH:ubiquinone oxidoreductase subunit NqrC
LALSVLVAFEYVMAKTKTQRNQKIHVDTLQTTLDKLGQLETKPKAELTLRESIYFLRDKLKSALRKGYSFQDLSDILANQEILISAATLKQYLTDIQKESSSRQRNKSRQVKQSNSKKPSVKTAECGHAQALDLKSRERVTSSTNVTSSLDELSKDVLAVETNRIKKVEKVVNTESSSNSSVEPDSDDSQFQPQISQSKHQKNPQTRPKVLSGSYEDLSSEFNHW